MGNKTGLQCVPQYDTLSMENTMSLIFKVNPNWRQEPKGHEISGINLELIRKVISKLRQP